MHPYDWNYRREIEPAFKVSERDVAAVQANAPSAVLGQIGGILAVTLSLALAVNLALAALGIP
jgi:hypothetical protein